MSGFQGCNTRVLNFSTVVEAGAYGALLATDLAVNKGWKEIKIEGDALTIINSLKYKHLPSPWRIQYTVNMIRENLSRFNSVDFRFIKKEANNVAHSLEAYTVSTHTSDVWQQNGVATTNLDVYFSVSIGTIVRDNYRVCTKVSHGLGFLRHTC